MWDRRTPLDQRSDGDVNATVDGGGPVVNAISGRGNIYLYDGTFYGRQALPPEWRQVRQALRPEPFNTPGAFERFRQLRGGKL
jgi:hypothetical protein